MNKTISYLVSEGKDTNENRVLARIGFLEGQEKLLLQLIDDSTRIRNIWAYDKYQSMLETVQRELKQLTR